MARVPIVQGPSIGLAPLSRERVRPADNGGGALGGLGRGLQELGQAGAQFSEAQDRLDEMLDEAAAKKLDNEAARRMREMLWTGEGAFFSKRGFDAATARPITEKAIGDLREELIGRATTDRQRRMFGDAFDHRAGGELEGVARHSVGQIAAERKNQSVARLENFREDAVAASDDTVRFSDFLEGGLGELRSVADQEGWAPETLTGAEARYRSEVHEAVVRKKLAVDDIDGAKRYLDDHRGDIDWKSEAALDSALQDPLQRREASSDVDGVMGMATASGSDSVAYADPLRGAGRGGPVAGGGYGAKRDYGAHQGVDIPAKRGTAVYSTAPGVAKVSRSAKGGNIVTVTHADGAVSRYMHLDQVKIQDGDQVSPDTIVGTVGMTGRSSGPHLHWEVTRGGKRVDPSTVVGQAQQSPRRHDLNGIYASIDKRAADEGWTFERRERAKAEADRRVSRDEQLFARQEQEAERSAWDAIDRLPDNKLTSMSQIPADVRGRLSPRARVQFEEEIARNLKPKEVAANGDAAITLKVLAARHPDQFAAMDLRPYRSQLTSGEFETLAVDQARMRAKPDEAATTANVRAEIDRAINFYGSDIGLGSNVTDRKNEDGRKTYGRISDSMRGYLERATDGGKRKPTDDDLKAAFDHATMEVIVRGGGAFGGDVTRRRHEVESGRIGVSIPVDAKSRIEQSFARQYRRLPSGEEVARIYLANKGKPGFWK